MEGSVNTMAYLQLRRKQENKTLIFVSNVLIIMFPNRPPVDFLSVNIAGMTWWALPHGTDHPDTKFLIYKRPPTCGLRNSLCHRQTYMSVHHQAIVHKRFLFV